MAIQVLIGLVMVLLGTIVIILCVSKPDLEPLVKGLGFALISVGIGAIVIAVIRKIEFWRIKNQRTHLKKKLQN